jgi:diguanylate cyclase (GGDEF)-like protein
MAIPGVHTRPNASLFARRLSSGAGLIASGLVGALLIALLATDRRRAADVAVLAVVAALAPAAVVAGLRRHRPARAVPWLLIALGTALLAAGAALRTAQSGWAGPHLTDGLHRAGTLLPSPVFVPGAALLVLGAGALAWSPTRRDRRNLDLLIEAALVGALAFSVSWAFWVGSTAGEAGPPSLARLGLAAAIPLAAMFGALVVSGFNRPPWRVAAGRRLLVGGAGLVAWTVLAQLERSNRLAIGVSWLECGLAAIALVLAAAALHPTMRQLSRRSRSPLDAAPARLRVAAAVAVAVVPIAVVLFRPEPGRGRPLALSVAAVVTVALGAWRAWRALRSTSGADARLAHEVTHDPLTGLANRSRLEEWTREALRFARPASTLAVILMDVDRFKVVNDTYGYAHGDRLLVEVARRREAGAGDGAMAARLGGDEFVVALSDAAGGTEGVRRTVERLQAALVAPFTLYEAEVYVTASVGVATASPGDPMSDAETLIRDADTAMYQAKEAGRDTVTFFDASMRDRIADRLALEQDLRLAIEREEFRLFFQPIVAIGAGGTEVVGLEALLRWDRPTRGLVPPSVFVAVAEESGLIVEIGEWVIREACRALVGWRRSAGADGLFVSVNVSALQLKNASLVSKLRGALFEGGLEPGSLCIELAESVLTEHPAEGAAFLLRLKEIGVRVAIDDFGTGYSSLAYLKQFPVDYVKIDHSFVAGLAFPDATDETLVAAIVSMAQSLDVITIAEGVEDELQDATLRALNVDLAQGFLYSRPVPAERVLDTLWALSPRHGLRLVTGDGGGGPPAR